jgi:hypothetical protein
MLNPQLPSLPQPLFQDYNSYKLSLLAWLAMLIEMETLYIMNALPFTLQGLVLYVAPHTQQIRAKLQGDLLCNLNIFLHDPEFSDVPFQRH